MREYLPQEKGRWEHLQCTFCTSPPHSSYVSGHLRGRHKGVQPLNPLRGVKWKSISVNAVIQHQISNISTNCSTLKLLLIHSCLNPYRVSNIFSCCKHLWKILEKLVSSGHAAPSESGVRSSSTRFYKTQHSFKVYRSEKIASETDF